MASESSSPPAQSVEGKSTPHEVFSEQGAIPPSDKEPNMVLTRPSGSKDPQSYSLSTDDIGAVGGATGTGVSRRPNTVDEFLRMEGANQMFAVQPLTWCPHLTEVRPLPSRELKSTDPCSACGDESENWVCLTCYKVACSRFVQEHMLYHRLETEHNLCLSYSDLSVWCYACDHYLDNEVLSPMKNAAHLSKFGEPLVGAH